MSEKQVSYKGYDIAVYQDIYYEHDDDMQDDVFIVANHRDFYKKRDGFNPIDIYESNKQFYEGYHAIPLYAYIHGNVSISTSSYSCRWDSCQVGYVMVKRIKGWSWTRDKAMTIATMHAIYYDHAINGEVYGVSIYKDDEMIDTQGGFIGSMELALLDAKQQIDRYETT